MYKCEICGQEYSSVGERAACEVKCVKKQEEKERLRAEEVYKAEKTKRYNEVVDAIKKADELMEAFSKEYGSFNVPSGTSSDLWNLLLSWF